MTWRAFGWIVLTMGAVAVALPGVVLYANDANAATSLLNWLLLAPLGALILYGLHRRLPRRVQWTGALLLAPLGSVAYPLWPTSQTWNYGILTPLPLILLAVLTEERRRRERGEDQQPYYGGWADGPWGPP